MLTVHHLRYSRSTRILWLLEELGRDYAIVSYDRDPKTFYAPPELKRVHPLGKAPVLVDGDTVVAESGAIIEYLLDRFDDGVLRPPPGTPERIGYLTFLHYAEGSAMTPLLLRLYLSRVGEAAQAVMTRVEGLIADELAFLESTLSERPYFAGAAFTAADIQMSYPLEVARARAGLDARFPALLAFLDRVHARPGYRRAIEKGGPTMPGR